MKNEVFLIPAEKRYQIAGVYSLSCGDVQAALKKNMESDSFYELQEKLATSTANVDAAKETVCAWFHGRGIEVEFNDLLLY
jgi:hypothetical protein